MTPAAEKFLPPDFKVPWWSRILGSVRGYLRAWRERRDELKRVNHITTVWSWHGAKDSRDPYVRYFGIYYICYEDGRGRRWFEFGRESSWVTEKRKAENTQVYADVIRPWTKGKYSNQALVDWANGNRSRPDVKKEA